MNVLELLRDILLHALKILYWFFAVLDVSWLGYEIFPGFRLYYVLGIVLACFIGKKWLGKVLMSPVPTLVFLGNLLLEAVRGLLFKLLPGTWNLLKNLSAGLSGDRAALWWEGVKERAENFWYGVRY